MEHPPAQTEFDRFDLYEVCVQSPTHLVPLLIAIHGGTPTVLGEDFAGTAALSLVWAGQRDETHAIAVDLDAESIGRHPEHERVRRVVGDVRDVDDPCDALFVGNFSIGYLHTRAELVAYLRHAHRRVEAGGMFLCDTYGGQTAYVTGGVHRRHTLPGGRVCLYTWEQRDADLLTGMVTNAIHFRVERAGVIETELTDAFVYEWRLWSVPELRDAMAEAGFERSEVYAMLADAVDTEGNAYAKPVTDPASELGDSYIVLVVGAKMTGERPACWKCGYELTGLGVDDLCPECGTPVWSRPPVASRDINAGRAQTWGIGALVLFFACIGPLAAFVAIPALVYASKAETEVRQGLVDRSAVRGATAGKVCAWITIGLSIAITCVYAAAIVISIL